VSNANQSLVYSGDRIDTLDGVRGLAILAVLVDHSAIWITPTSTADRVVQAFTGSGWEGVDLFFVLSGFLITGILLDAKGGRHYFRNFYARRVLRIFPIYYLTIALVLLSSFIPVVAHHFADATAEIRRVQPWYWTYTTNYLIVLHGWASAPMRSSHLWSLAVEEQFYLIWPALIFLVDRRTLARICIGLLILCPIMRLALFLSGTPARDLVVATPARLDTLALGALLAIAARSEGGLARWRRPLAAIAIPSILLLASTLTFRNRIANESPEIATIGFSLIAAVAGTLVTFATTTPVGTVAHRFLAHPALRAVGRYSYAMYIFHFPVVGLLHARHLAPDTMPTLLGSHLPAQFGFTILCFAVTYVIAFASWHLFEHPILRLKDHFPYDREPVSVSVRYLSDRRIA
jgi:peptidoglycan/LPS O-acetylase OafA/YrhL